MSLKKSMILSTVVHNAQINELIFKWPNSIQLEVNLDASAGEISVIADPLGLTTLFNIISDFTNQFVQ